MSNDVELISRRIVLIRTGLGKSRFGISDKSPLKNVNVFIKQVSESLRLPMVKCGRDGVNSGEFSGKVVCLEDTFVDGSVDDVGASPWGIGGKVEWMDNLADALDLIVFVAFRVGARQCSNFCGHGC